ncbi:nesprin-2 isoform X2 [Mobula hypostoma]|uniref:nesprin-2 isoform X2 n=1 Tax=Mobula hypostoma TaxID=723540 RepID=UPI002FC350BD
MQRYEGREALPLNRWNAETRQKDSHSAVKLLDRQLEGVCLHSLERSIKIQYSWQLQQELLKDYSHFNDWMQSAEATARDPRTSQIHYSEAKVELNRFELLRKQIGDMMISLESINWRYRRLAREPRVEVAQELKGMVHNGNQRWDILQRRVGSIYKRLKYFVSQREEFENKQGHLWQQVMDLDIRLTQLQYFCTEGAPEKINQLQGLQQKITGITAETDELLLNAETLLQKSESLDAVTIEAEVWDLLQFQQELFVRIARFHKRLLRIDLELEYLSNNENCEADYPCDRKLEEGHVSGYRSTPTHKEDLSDIDPGQSSPSSLDSLPLEWDPSVDIGEDIDFRHGALPDMLTSLVGKRTRKSQKKWGWAKIASSTPQKMAAGRQGASEGISMLGERGPCGVQTQTHGGGLWQDATDLGRTTTETRRMRKMKRRCQGGQSLNCKPSGDRKGRDQSDPRQDRSLGLHSRATVKDVEHRLCAMEPEQKQDLREISLPGGISRGGSQLQLLCKLQRLLCVKIPGDQQLLRCTTHCFWHQQSFDVQSHLDHISFPFWYLVQTTLNPLTMSGKLLCIELLLHDWLIAYLH